MIRPPTKMQQEVLLLLSKDLTAKEVAGLLGVAERTVANHIYQACKRMGVQTRVGACCMAMREGWI